MKRRAKLLWILSAIPVLAVLLQAALPHVPTGTWVAADPLAQPRSGAVAVLLQNGVILITGGEYAGSALTSTELFGTNGVVSPAAPMNFARSKHAAVVLKNGNVLVAGGTTSGGGVTNSAEVYDPATNVWTNITSGMHEARIGHTATLLENGRALIAGGRNSSQAVSISAEVFDPSTNNFTWAGTLSSPRTEHASARLPDARVLWAGGSDGTNALAASDIYDEATGAISAGPALTIPRRGLTATALLDGRVLLAGGNNGSIDLLSAEIFDPIAGVTSPIASSMSFPRKNHAAFLLPNSNAVLIVSGTSNGNHTAATDLFIPWAGAGTFQPTGNLNTVRSLAAGSALQHDGLLLIAGGENATSTALSATELYGFATVKSDKDDYAPGEIVTISGSGWQPGEIFGGLPPRLYRLHRSTVCPGPTKTTTRPVCYYVDGKRFARMAGFRSPCDT